MRLAVFLLTALLIFSSSSFSKTLFLEGSSATSIKLKQDISFNVTRPVSELSFRFALPLSYSNYTSNQTVKSININYSIEPVSVKEVKDKFGNRFVEVKWKNLDMPVHITIESTVEKNVFLEKNRKYQPAQEDLSVYLIPTKQVQSKSEQIVELARKLADGSANKHEIVEKVVNFVNENIKYVSNPPKYDAVWTLENGIGNCQNMAHLTIALLRALGIPARIVGGITVKEPWEVKFKDRTIKYSMGQGGHAWVEVYLPDTGWVEYDPQQSKYFASTRHIRQTHGMDSEDINDSWTGSPYLPSYSESISYQIIDDKQKYSFVKEKNFPRSYMASLLYEYGGTEKFKVMDKDKSEKHLSIPPKKEDLPVKTEIGNTALYNFVDIYRVSGNTGYKTFDRETAELMTKSRIYAQGFKVDRDVKLKKISLGMRKFGGEGKMFIFLVSDSNGRPADSGLKSLEVSSENLPKKGGYYWVDFDFGREIQLKPGKYWIIFGFTGDLIINWLYTPANPYGDEDDTVSTSLDFKWDSVHNLDFVFKVSLR